MDVRVNERTISKALNDEKFKAELIEYLNSVVDEELEKGEHMDTDLITDCTEMIFELDEGDIDSIIADEKSSENIINFEQAKRSAEKAKPKHTVIRMRRIIVVAAILMILGTVTTAFADDIIDYFTYISQLLFSAADESGEESNVRMIWYFEKDGTNVNYNIHSEDEIDLSQFEIGVWYEQELNTEIDLSKPDEVVPISECTVKEPRKTVDDEGNPILVVVIVYRDTSTEIEYRLIDEQKKE
ncbi:MAG: hypothetical protein IJI47_02515 [Eubacterium sp.]|nr:hypothetical protein [Eubacterium sp.]MBR0412426.1 hypothetical protein [Eubacterium sp.]